MDENNKQPNNAVVEKTRTQRIEEFLLNPDKVVFESIEEFQVAVRQLLDIFNAVDLASLERLEGKDGYTPKRGVDYFTEEDLQGIEQFILSKVPKIGVDLPTVAQVEQYVRDQVAKIKVVKGEDGKSLTFDDLTDEQKDELRGKDGSPDSGLDIIKKLRSVGKNQMLQIDDIRGLKNVLKNIVEEVDSIAELRSRLDNLKISVGAGTGGGEGGGEPGADGNTVLNGADDPDDVADGVDGDFYINTTTWHIFGPKAAGAWPAGVDMTAGGGGSGDMLAATYDPTNVAGDAFDMDNMVEGSDTKIMTAAERAKLGHISVSQAVNLDTIETDVAASKAKTDQITVTQAVDLDAMEVKTNHISVSQAVNLDTMESDIAAAKAKTDHITVTQAVDLDTIETRVNALDAAVVLMGGWDASAGTFPGGGTAQAGASYIVTVAGTVDGVAFNINDRVLAIADNASTGTYANNWLKLDYTDQVLSVVGLTGAVSKAGLQAAIDLSGVNTGDETTTTLGSKINGATDKATPVDADQFGLVDSAASNVLKKLTWANLKATMKAYYDAATSTFTNKTMIASTNVVEEITTTASSATPTPTGGSLRNLFTVTALAAGATFAAPSGTPADGNRLMIRIKDNGTARTLAFNAIYRAIGITLPTTTVINKTMYLGAIYNSADSKWDVTAYGIEA